ncbi:MAG: hypothetical protein E7021_04300 [Alphaproteobacteria bacterium]|nr:hypothetical protein [Alphaproteobacteria bacterium]
MNFNIHIPIPTLKQAYQLFLQNISRIDWYEENGRPYFLQSLKQMNKPLINQMIEERDLLKTDENKYVKKFQHPFEKELYHPERYERLANEILSYKDTFDKIYNKFKAMHDSWGFIILSEYTIDLNMYVGNGSYNAKTGHILLGIKGGGIQVNMSTIKLIMHEMIHLGIENLIVKDKSGKLLLQQEEKERVVDNLCQYVGKGIFDEKLLQFQSITEPYSYMDKLCTGQPQKDLVKEIQRFLKENEKV